MSDTTYNFETVGEIVNSIQLLLQHEEDAERFLEEYVAYMSANNPDWDREASLRVCLVNIGYCAGCIGIPAMDDVRRIFGARHPYFG